MKFNYTLDKDNKIIECHEIPFDATKPFIETNEIIRLGIDKVIDGKFVKVADEVKISRIAELKRLLADSDYLCLKHADGALSDEEYAETRAQRQAWRDEINSLEN